MRTWSCSLRTRILTLFATMMCVTPVVKGGALSANEGVRDSLVRRLDSIEVRLQERRRSGVGIADLEKQSRAIQDSLSALRVLISPVAGHSTGPESASGRTQWKLPYDLPTNTIDWVIIAVGGTAVLSGLVLFAGIVRSWFGRSGKVRPKRPATASEKFGKTSRTSVPEPMPQPAPLPAVGLAAEVDKIRKRMLETRPGPALPEIDSLRPVSATRSMGAQPFREDVRSVVAAEAEQGLSASEISRKHHLGVDQVELILRVEQKKSPPPTDTI